MNTTFSILAVVLVLGTVVGASDSLKQSPFPDLPNTLVKQFTKDKQASQSTPPPNALELRRDGSGEPRYFHREPNATVPPIRYGQEPRQSSDRQNIRYLRATGAVRIRISEDDTVAMIQQSTEIKRAVQYADRAKDAAERAGGMLDKSIASKEVITDSARQSAENQLEKAVKDLEKAKDFLSKAEAGDSGRAEAEKAIAAAQEAIDGITKRLNDATEQIRKNDELNAGGADKDQKTIDALREVLPLLGNDCRANQVDRARVDNWPQIKKDIEDLHNRYGKAAGSRGSNRDFVNSVKALKSEFDQFKFDLEKNFNRKQKELLTTFQKKLAEHVEIGNASDLSTTFRIHVPSLIKILEDRIYVYERLGKDQPGFDPAIIESVKQDIAEAREAARKHMEKIIAGNEPPKEGYTGADKESLKAAVRSAFLKVHPKANIVKVILEDTGFLRVTSWKWSDSLAWYKEDISTTDAYVLVSTEEPKYVAIWGTPIVRNNMAGGAQSVIVPTDIKKTVPEQLVFASKVK
ncbi:MAG: hypothetical protein MUC92_11565 [Fimbriimonadaceae bacterium]|jgi:hypothetical protein|nr:hypothetical protein [Fimbriimonadaceae bacterium]